MTLKPQDILVALKLYLLKGELPPYSALATELGMSPAEVHAGVRRGIKSGLVLADSRQVNPHALQELILHGLQYVFPAERGPITRGMPTAHGAPPLRGRIRSDDLPPVWPDPQGEVRGEGFEPLYRSAPEAARKDEKLYRLLALIDALRGGRQRERNLARQELEKLLAT